MSSAIHRQIGCVRGSVQNAPCMSHQAGETDQRLVPVINGVPEGDESTGREAHEKRCRGLISCMHILALWLMIKLAICLYTDAWVEGPFDWRPSFCTLKILYVCGSLASALTWDEGVAALWTIQPADANGC